MFSFATEFGIFCFFPFFWFLLRICWPLYYCITLLCCQPPMLLSPPIFPSYFLNYPRTINHLNLFYQVFFFSFLFHHSISLLWTFVVMVHHHILTGQIIMQKNDFVHSLVLKEQNCYFCTDSAQCCVTSVVAAALDLPCGSGRWPQFHPLHPVFEISETCWWTTFCDYSLDRVVQSFWSSMMENFEEICLELVNW